MILILFFTIFSRSSSCQKKLRKESGSSGSRSSLSLSGRSSDRWDLSFSYTGIELSFQLSCCRALVNSSFKPVELKISFTEGGTSILNILQNSAIRCASLNENKLHVSASPGGFAVDVGSNSPELECSGA